MDFINTTRNFAEGMSIPGLGTPNMSFLTGGQQQQQPNQANMFAPMQQQQQPAINLSAFPSIGPPRPNTNTGGSPPQGPNPNPSNTGIPNAGADTIFGFIRGSIGAKTRDRYVQVANVWFSQVTATKSPQEIGDLILFLMRACNKFPCGGPNLDSKYQENFAKGQQFANEVGIKGMTAPQASLEKDYNRLRALFNAYPNRGFEWDALMSLKPFQDIADRMVQSLYIVSTETSQFMYLKGLYKAENIDSVLPLMMMQEILLIKSIAAARITDLAWLPNGMVLQEPRFKEIGDNLTSVVEKMYTNKPWSQVGNAFMSLATDDKSFPAAALALSKFLIVPNYNLLRMCKDYRQNRKKNVTEYNKQLLNIVGLMVDQIKIGFFIATNSVAEFPQDRTMYQDPKFLESYERSLKEVAKVKPITTMAQLFVNIGTVGIVNFSIGGDFMNLYWLSQRVIKNYMRSLKRALYGMSGTGENTRIGEISGAYKVGADRWEEKDVDVQQAAASVAGLKSAFNFNSVAPTFMKNAYS